MNQSQKINTNYKNGELVKCLLYDKNNPEKYPELFEIQKYNKDFGTVEYRDNKKYDSIGIAYIRKANLLEKFVYYVKDLKNMN